MQVNAIDGFSEPLEDLRAALDASGVVGTWDWDCVKRTARYDAGAAALLTGHAGLAGQSLDAETAMAAIHPDDRDWLRRETVRAIAAGGLIVSEYRVVSPTHGTHWLLSRGRVILDAVGRPLRCKGILIDITETRREASDETAGGYIAQAGIAEEEPLSRAASCCLEARRLIGGEADGSQLRLLLDMALYEIGRRLADRARR